MDPVIARKLQKVGEAFHLEGPFFSYEEISQGNVNNTYKVNYIRDDGTGIDVLKALKTEPRKAEPTKQERAEQKTRDEISGDGRKLHELCQTGHHKSREHTDTELQQNDQNWSLQSVNVY